MSKSLLAVFGATGNQGNSTANFVLNDPSLSQRYAVRAISRDTSNPKMQDLQSKGAELVQADLNDPSSLPTALKGADSMSHPYKISNGALKNVEHWDDKAEIEAYIRGLPVKSAFFAPGSFMQNFLVQLKPQPSPAGDGTFVLGNIVKGSTVLPIIDITDTGKWIGAILADPDKYEGKFFAAAESLHTFDEVCKIMEKVTGKTVKYQQFPDEMIKGFFPEAMRELLFEMWVLVRDYGYYGENTAEQVSWARDQAKGKLTGLEEFLRKQEYKLE